MVEPVVRGYSIQQTAAFIDKYYDDDTRKHLYEHVSAEVREQVGQLSSASWYPQRYAVELLRGIAGVKNDEVGSYNDLVASGKYVAIEATNTFLKLLLKMLTPALFFKKVPSFWERDTRNCGRYEVDTSEASEGRVLMRLVGAVGYDHVCIAGIGFLENALANMGKRDLKIMQKGWSLATPSPPEVELDIRWQ